VAPGSGTFGTVWEPGQWHRDYPNVIASPKANEWWPAPGYKWVAPGSGTFGTVWEPGQWHRDHPNVVAGERPDTWSPAAGYTWTTSNQTRITDWRVQGDTRVRETLVIHKAAVPPRNEPADFELKLVPFLHIVGGFGKREEELPGFGKASASPQFYLVHPPSGLAISSSAADHATPGGLAVQRGRATPLQLFKPQWVRGEGIYLIGTKAAETKGAHKTVFLHADGRFKAIQADSTGAAPLFRVRSVEAGLVRIASLATEKLLRLHDGALAFEPSDELSPADFAFTLVTETPPAEMPSLGEWTIFLKEPHGDFLFGPAVVSSLQVNPDQQYSAHFSSGHIGVLQDVDLEIRTVEGSEARQLVRSGTEKVLVRRDDGLMFVPISESAMQDSHFLWLFVVSFDDFEREWLAAVRQTRAAN
jgi:hypothetical protein